MVRKKRTDQLSGGESSESQEASGGSGRGMQRSAERGAPPQQGGGGYQGGRGWAQQGGRGSGGRGRGMPQHQQYGGSSEYQGRGRGGAPQQGGSRGPGTSGSRGGGPYGGPSRSQVPELHQATPPYQAGVPTQPTPSEASSSSRPPEISQLSQQFEQVGLQQEGAPSQAIQPVPPSSKSVRFPLRPGKGVSGKRCVVKANHFFAELPDKDLHQYDVSSLTSVFRALRYYLVMHDMSAVSACVRLLLHQKSLHGVSTVLLWSSWLNCTGNPILEDVFLPMMAVRVFILLGLFPSYQRSSKSFSLMKMMDQEGNGNECSFHFSAPLS